MFEFLTTYLNPTGFDLILTLLVAALGLTLYKVDKRLTELTPEDDKPIMPADLARALEGLLNRLAPSLTPKEVTHVAKSLSYHGRVDLETML